jgi:outer membrane lipoprotein SlyB
MAFNRKAVAWFANPHNLVYVIFAITVVLLSTGVLAQSGNIYSDRSAQAASPVVRAVILQTRDVEVAPSDATRYAGSAAGGALGGGLGVALGRGGNNGTALGIVGAVLGGLGGAAATNRLGASRAIEYLVQIPADQWRPEQLMSITQPDPGQQMLPGDAVYLINTNGTWRVVKAMQPMAPARFNEPAGFGRQSPVPGPRKVEVQFNDRS